MAEQKSKLVIEIDSRNALRDAQALGRELESIDKKGQFASKSMDQVSVATRQLAGYMAGLVTVGAAVAKMDAYTGMQNRLKLVTESQEQLNLAMSDTFSIAQKSYQSWDSVIQVYQRFSDNAKTLKIDMSKTAELTETVSKAVAISGASTQAAEAALTQFGQALASGTLRGEELNSILEQTPALAKAIAQGMGITVGQLRSVAAEGKITGEVLVDALTKSKKSVDELFAKTDITIGQSIQLLSNEVTKFTGEAGKASGVATTLASSIQILANNLDAIAGIAVVGGVALLTKTIAAQTVAIHGSISAAVAKRAADAAALQSQVQLAAVEVQRTRQVTALALTEINLARQELNSATTRQARAAATMRLTQAEIALNIATKNTTVATAAYSAAQATAATTSLTLAGAARTALAFMTGPVGLGITMATVAAGYMYMSNKGEDANKMLDTQSRYAGMAADELARLGGAQRKAAEADLSKELGILNDKLKASENQFEALVEKVLDSNKTNTEAKRIWSELRAGAIGVDEAYARLNNADFVTTDQINQLTDGKKKVDDNKAAIKSANEQLERVQVSGSKAKQGFKDAADGAKNSAEQVALLNKELADYNKGLQDREFDAVFTKNLLAKKFTEGEINALLEAANAAREKGLVATEAMYRESLRIYRLEKGNKDTIDSRNAAERKLTQEKEKQLKLGQRLIGISGNSGIGTGAHLDVRYGGSRDGQKVSKEHLARLEAGGKSLSNYRVSSDYGNRKAPTKGASSFHKGIDFAMPVGTPITTKVAVKDIKTAYDSKGGGYYSTVTFEDGVVLKLLHQSPSMMGKVKGGASDGTLKANQDIEKQAEQQANTQLQLQMAVATERKRIETQLQEDIKKINKAGFSPEETKRLIAEYQARADNDIAIAEYALKTKLDDYSSFKKTEDELLKDSFDQKKFYAAHDIELSKDQRDKAVTLLDEQLKQEQALIKLAKETRIFQAEQAMMTEIQRVQKRYQLEREEIIKTANLDVEERTRRLNALNAKMIRGGVGNNFSDPNDKGSQFLQSVDYAPIPKSNIQRLDEENAEVLRKLKANLDAVKEAENTSHEERLEAERVFNDAKQQLQDEYDFKAQDARRMDYENQLSMYSSMISMTSGVFGELMSIVSEYKEENTKTYKTMFALQKAAALAQAIVSTELAATQVMADPTALTMSQKMLYAGIIRTTGYMSAGIIAAQMFAGPGGEGYSNGGFTGIGGKFDPAGIVHKGEVVWSQEDIKRWGGVNVVEAMRTSQPPTGYSDGGLVTPKDTYRVGMGTVDAIERGANVQAERQAQANVRAQAASPQPIESNVRVGIFDDRDDMMNQMYGRDGEKIVMYHLRRNGMLKP